MTTPRLVDDLRRQLQDVESDLRHVLARLRASEERALLAEKSCRDAWQFARAVLPAGRNRTTDQ